VSAHSNPRQRTTLRNMSTIPYYERVFRSYIEKRARSTITCRRERSYQKFGVDLPLSDRSYCSRKLSTNLSIIRASTICARPVLLLSRRNHCQFSVKWKMMKIAFSQINVVNTYSDSARRGSITTRRVLARHLPTSHVENEQLSLPRQFLTSSRAQGAHCALR